MEWMYVKLSMKEQYATREAIPFLRKQSLEQLEELFIEHPFHYLDGL